MEELSQFRYEVIRLVSQKEDVRAMCHLVVQVYAMCSLRLGSAQGYQYECIAMKDERKSAHGIYQVSHLALHGS